MQCTACASRGIDLDTPGALRARDIAQMLSRSHRLPPSRQGAPSALRAPAHLVADVRAALVRLARLVRRVLQLRLQQRLRTRRVGQGGGRREGEREGGRGRELHIQLLARAELTGRTAHNSAVQVLDSLIPSESVIMQSRLPFVTLSPPSPASPHKQIQAHS
jgi:hypothetical protein